MVVAVVRGRLRSAGHRLADALAPVFMVIALLFILAAPLLAEEAPPEPGDYRMNDYRSPVPATLKGARVVRPAEARSLMAEKAIFIDVYPHPPKPANLPAGTVWRDPAHESIEGAVWLANVGYGKLAPEVADYFRAHLAALTENGKSQRPIVFFCLRNCWMSWNAAKRALEWGFANVVWYPDGTDGWRESGLPIAALKPLP